MSIGDDLQKLAEMHQRGQLTGDEFARAKSRLLGATDRAGPDRTVDSLNALTRSRSDRWIGGVCAGLATVTGLAAWMWRLMFALLAFCGGTGVLIYLLLWLFVPEDNEPNGTHPDRSPAA